MLLNLKIKGSLQKYIINKFLVYLTLEYVVLFERLDVCLYEYDIYYILAVSRLIN